MDLWEGKAERTNGSVFLSFQISKKILRDPIVGHSRLVEEVGGMKQNFLSFPFIGNDNLGSLGNLHIPRPLVSSF